MTATATTEQVEVHVPAISAPKRLVSHEFMISSMESVSRNMVVAKLTKKFNLSPKQK